MQLPICLFICISIWIYFQFYSSWNKPWIYFRLITLSEEYPVYNLTCYSNGTIIFHGINNTAYKGMKIFQLEINRMNIIHEFIRTHSFKSNLQSKDVSFHIKLSDKNEIYFWKNDTRSYQLLTLLLNIKNLISYKQRSVLFQTTPILRKKNIKQNLKRSLIIPTTKSPFIQNDYNKYFIPIIYSIKTIEIPPSTFADDLCLSSQIIISTFDLIDACLSTNDIINDNQFYPLRDQLIDLSTTLSSVEPELTTQNESVTQLTTSTTTTESTTLSANELQAVNDVNHLFNISDSLSGPDDVQVTNAQELVESLPDSSSVKAGLLQRLAELKASLHKTTEALHTTAHATMVELESTTNLWPSELLTSVTMAFDNTVYNNEQSTDISISSPIYNDDINSTTTLPIDTITTSQDTTNDDDDDI